MTEQEQKVILTKNERWGESVSKILDDPATAQTCPFCNEKAVHASWSLYDEKSRGASFDIWCTHCKERMHAAILLPPLVSDTYPPRIKKCDSKISNGNCRSFNLARTIFSRIEIISIFICLGIGIYLYIDKNYVLATTLLVISSIYLGTVIFYMIQEYRR